MDYIVRQKGFWAEDDESVLKAIHEGFLQTHYAMWKELEKWPKTASGLPSTAGTTASIAFIRSVQIFFKSIHYYMSHCQEGKDLHWSCWGLGHHPWDTRSRQSGHLASRTTHQGPQTRIAW